MKVVTKLNHKVITRKWLELHKELTVGRAWQEEHMTNLGKLSKHCMHCGISATEVTRPVSTTEAQQCSW